MMSDLKTGFRSLLPACNDVSHLQSEALDTTLPPLKRFGLWLHLLICKWCRRYGHQLRFLRDAAHNNSERLTETVPQNLSPAARERIKQRLQSGK